MSEITPYKNKSVRVLHQAAIGLDSRIDKLEKEAKRIQKKGKEVPTSISAEITASKIWLAQILNMIKESKNLNK